MWLNSYSSKWKTNSFPVNSIIPINRSINVNQSINRNVNCQCNQSINQSRGSPVNRSIHLTVELFILWSSTIDPLDPMGGGGASFFLTPATGLFSGEGSGRKVCPKSATGIEGALRLTGVVDDGSTTVPSARGGNGEMGNSTTGDGFGSDVGSEDTTRDRRGRGDGFGRTFFSGPFSTITISGVEITDVGRILCCLAAIGERPFEDGDKGGAFCWTEDAISWLFFGASSSSSSDLNGLLSSSSSCPSSSPKGFSWSGYSEVKEETDTIPFVINGEKSNLVLTFLRCCRHRIHFSGFKQSRRPGFDGTLCKAKRGTRIQKSQKQHDCQKKQQAHDVTNRSLQPIKQSINQSHPQQTSNTVNQSTKSRKTILYLPNNLVFCDFFVSKEWWTLVNEKSLNQHVDIDKIFQCRNQAINRWLEYRPKLGT